MRTLRGRLFASFGLAALISAVLTVAVAAPLTRRSLEHRTLEEMRRRLDVTVAFADQLPALPRAADRVERSFRVHGELLLLPGRVAAVPGGRLLYRAVLATGDDAGRLTVSGRDLLFVVADTEDGPAVLTREGGLDTSPFVRSLVLAGLGGAVMAALLAWYLSRRLTRPIRRVSEASGRLAAGHAEARVAVEGQDELAGLARSFNHMADELQSAREAERTFLLSVSHELRTPLTAIRGYAEAVGDGASEPEEAARVIGAEAERLERLVRDLLDLARLDQRRFAVSRGPVDLAEVARETQRRLAPAADGLDVELELVGPERADGVGDRDRLVQVLSNLTENALRVTPAGGRVTLLVAPGLLEVADTGPGLRAEDLPRAFDRFYLHERAGSDRAVGSGLGLAIVKELVEAMGGSVEVSSEAGRGATFRVRIPTTQA